MARTSKGVPAGKLTEEDLVRELRHLYDTRADTFFGGSRSALQRHTERMAELEGEYASRHVDGVEPDPARTRKGTRARAGQKITGGTAKPRAGRKAPPDTPARGRGREGRKTTGAGRGAPGVGRSPGKRGGVSRRGASKATGSANRTAGGRARRDLVRGTVGGRRRPKSGTQG